MAKFFINRPIFAIVIALLIMLAGALSVRVLPVEQFPPIAPPSVQINASFAGASAATVQNTVVQVIEQQMSGIDNLLYMSSTSDDTGQSTTTLTFDSGTDSNIAQVQVQNKLQLALPLLPAQVQQTGVRVTKSTSSFLMVPGFVSQNRSMSKFDIADYVASNIQDPLSPDGAQVRLRDVARIGLGAENFNVDNKYNGQPATGIGGMLAATFVATFLIPMFYVVISKLAGGRKRPATLAGPKQPAPDLSTRD